VLIPYDADQKTLDFLYSGINGLFFTGGGVEIFYTPENPDNILTKNAQYLLNKVMNDNDNGVVFPVWGTCLGFELLTYIFSGLDE
jgi:gamma-glutamyl hydrolase